jgi:hypothetical protein
MESAGDFIQFFLAEASQRDSIRGIIVRFRDETRAKCDEFPESIYVLRIQEGYEMPATIIGCFVTLLK